MELINTESIDNESIDNESKIIESKNNTVLIDTETANTESTSNNESTDIKPPEITLNIIAEMNKKIDDYIARFANNPRQHDPDWGIRRKKTIGGSEVSTLAGKNHFTSLYELVCTKVGIKHFAGNIKTWWGTMFEPMIQKITEHDLDTQIKGSDIFISGIIDNMSYSPDGLGAIDITVQEESDGQIREQTEKGIALFEFKCPYNRWIKGNIPDYYLPQVLAGLDMISIADLGIYVEAMFRRCAFDDLDFTPKYNRAYTPADLKRTNYTPSACGFILFTAFDLSSEQYDELLQVYAEAGRSVIDYTKNPNQEFDISAIPDFGADKQELFEYAMELWDKRILHVEYSEIIYSGESDVHDIRAEYLKNMIDNQKSTGKIICGIIPWKLLRVDYNYVTKQPGYLSQFRDKAAEIISLVERCRNNPSDRMRFIAQYFYPRKPVGGNTPAKQ